VAAGDASPVIGKKMVTETEPKNTSANVPMNSAMYACLPIFISNTGGFA